MSADTTPNTPLPSLQPRQTTTPSSARTALANRVLITGNTDALASDANSITNSATDISSTGLVIGGTGMFASVRRIRAAFRDLFIMCDPPESGKYFATAEDPFPLGPSAAHDGLVAPPTLAERLTDQRSHGASVAVTPTGYIRAGERDALKAVIDQSNQLDRDDTVVLLPLDYQWLRDDLLKMLIGATKRSRHPLAVTLGDSTNDPMSHPRILDGARTLCSLDTTPMFHRTDLAGFHLMARGALSVSIGTIGSKRRAVVVGKDGFSPSTNRGATVLVAELARFKRSLDMHYDWFGSRNPYTCSCSVCNGAPIDRFETYDSAEASQHNAAGLLAYIHQAQLRGGYEHYWPDVVTEALLAHERLGAYLGRPIEAPTELKAWAK